MPTLPCSTPSPRRLPRLAFPFLKFSLTLLLSTIACTLLWQTCITNHLYHCTDSLDLDYLAGPSNFVHGTIAGQPENVGDTLAPGWTLPRLQTLWFSLLTASLLLSLLLARLPWSRVSLPRIVPADSPR